MWTSKSSVAVACFLPGLTKDLSASLYYSLFAIFRTASKTGKETRRKQSRMKMTRRTFIEGIQTLSVVFFNANPTTSVNIEHLSNDRKQGLIQWPSKWKSATAKVELGHAALEHYALIYHVYVTCDQFRMTGKQETWYSATTTGNLCTTDLI